MAKKTSCTVSRQQFRENAKPLTITVNGREFIAAPKEFSTASLGWNVNDKMTVMIGDMAVALQVGMNLTVIGSKELPE